MARVKRKARRYTDDDRVNALAALKANGGNILRTARELDIDAKTIRSWRDNPVVEQVPYQKARDMATELRKIAWKLLDSIEDKIKDATLSQATVAMGIAIDKAQLLDGRPTEITESTADISVRAYTDEELEIIDSVNQRAKSRLGGAGTGPPKALEVHGADDGYVSGGVASPDVVQPT